MKSFQYVAVLSIFPQAVTDQPERLASNTRK